MSPRDGKRRKMKVLRPPDESGLVWLNCLKTNALVCCEYDPDTDSLRNARDLGDFGEPAPEEFRTYVPEESYEIGEFIYHQTWRDVGRVIDRRELPGGRYSIDVAFLNFGLKMLIVESTTFTR
ncbi:MAG: hypothetical protein KC591_04215 [Gemmatimonadetes bacterium]|nr:hypothetical protein [Gemmatimonadota bacterium]